MGSKSIKKLVENYLDEAKLMQIATSKNNKPWAASVWYANDKSMNLYFISRKSRRHSIELNKNRNVAGCIVKPHTIGSGQKVRGIQFEGTARQCNLTEIRKANDLYLKKYPKAERTPISKLLSPKLYYTYYIIKPKRIVLFDEVNFPEHPEQELVL
ncbi:MAG TPA: pyridoxamine 5'-phosphate oxidase family protein [Candidatus Acidoferrum sp.]|nr:pyridoxamine 5'-phosphate oxidase family protein [Candidatus Acidoferrum sp.]